jgi:hypothetical protein
MAQDHEDFLRRWSRRKHRAAQVAEQPKPAAEPPSASLPALDSLNFESDFKAFLRAKIDEGVKRAALKKLFSDPRFNVMDGLDVYIDDYTKGEVLSPELVAALEHAKSTLLGPKQEDQKTQGEKPAEKPGAEDAAPKSDEPPRQDA